MQQSWPSKEEGEIKTPKLSLIEVAVFPKKTFVELNNLINILPAVKRTTLPDQIVLMKR